MDKANQENHNIIISLDRFTEDFATKEGHHENAKMKANEIVEYLNKKFNCHAVVMTVTQQD